ncbi:hypothetical protein Nepgr_031438 [Nepenthes gracilis]|uniref:Uncharacterized protein n=1 Tax=Nepenthes gracilis TaxID=150966 RepID=A0AAD3Y6U5_NEPGR|nr:hypothetical protein Nepgr_031438 [Nepenthes gracilis]
MRWLGLPPRPSSKPWWLLPIKWVLVLSESLAAQKNSKYQNRSSAQNADDQHNELVIGDAQGLIEEDYEDADFVVVDCNLQHLEGILGAV